MITTKQKQFVLLLLISAFIAILIHEESIFSTLLHVLLSIETTVHELSHCLTAWLTGGNVNGFVVSTDKWGSYSMYEGGFDLIVRSAGHIGATFFVTIWLVLANRSKVRAINAAIGIVLIILVALWQRPDYEKDLSSRNITFAFSTFLIISAVIATEVSNKLTAMTVIIVLIWQNFLLMGQTALYSTTSDINDATWAVRSLPWLSSNQMAWLWIAISLALILTSVVICMKGKPKAAQ